MAHQHIYNEKGEQLCCTLEDKVNAQAEMLAEQQESHGHSHDDHDHSQGGAGSTWIRMFAFALVSLLLLMTGIALDHWIRQDWFAGTVRILWYIAAYAPVGLPVIKDAVRSIIKGDIFSEFFLMTLATIGAFAIGEYPEGVAVMLFYAVGEIFQTMAVSGRMK